MQAINEHRLERVTLSDLICVDESISRWYGLGGHWIDLGLPQYVAIDHKPENMCEIQDAACGRCSVMMRLELVTTAEEEALTENGEMWHGAAVVKCLVSPWSVSHRIVCADSYFAIVYAA